MKDITSATLIAAFFASFFFGGCVRQEERTPPEEIFAKLSTAQLAGYTGLDAESARRNALHLAHFNKKITDCSTCHRMRRELVSTDVELCKKCHAEIRFNAPVVQHHCVTCHNFKRIGVEEPELPTREDCIRCHAQKELEEKYRVVFSFFEPNSAMRIDCRYCHKPHEIGEFTPLAWCANCHGNYADKSIIIGGHQVCTTCHQPHTWRFEFTAKNCTQCHEAKAQVIEHSLPPHPKECSACHNPHFRGTLPKTGDCDFCHSGRGKVLPALIPAHRDCMKCHSPQKFSFKGTSACLKCHEKSKQFTAIAGGKAPSAHINCKNCHRPHAFKASFATCSSCHKALPENLAHSLATHKGLSCQRCHSPHLYPKAPPATSCSSCHPGRNDFIRGADAPHRESACEVCHEMKPFRFIGTKSSCQACHSFPPDKEGSQWSSAPELHQACLFCHKAHNFKVEEAEASCATCHKSIASASEKMPFCITCHESPHLPSPSPSVEVCSACHAEVAEKVGSTVKANCALCHKPHRWATDTSICATCHSDISRQVSSTPMPDCTICHSSHTFKAELALEACAVCHPQREALHNKEFHASQACTVCHSAHSFRPSRSTCLNCHSDKQDHYPGKDCADCHLFVAGAALQERIKEK